MKLISSVLVAASLAMSAVSGFAQEAAAAAKPDLAKGQASFTAVCVACHGPDGNSLVPDYPKLAQQHPEYLIKQLQEFKAGKRQNAIMLGFSAMLSDEDMKNIAYWVTTNKAAPGTAADADLIAQGKRIYLGGVLDRNIPACAGCHGPAAAGIPAQYPRLKGQQANYVVTQLTTFRSGERNNNLQMTGVAAKLNDREIKAVAEYVASLK
ncbi:c-type cytochrome [Rhodoferax fermentans]|uniref:Cytochrome c4 n=1 Tax=Rhodoferax fermentans TaxID=28066 RepID=A0A1T1AR12_RHOFE|nr:c-type cytochrome [Rhodoferax fermentans]MBK1682828.1 cytochrome c4 [Rhodoferax fermentans]OOV06415.1 cytochrome c4 [Rhodoferax fermentans]